MSRQPPKTSSFAGLITVAIALAIIGMVLGIPSIVAAWLVVGLLTVAWLTVYRSGITHQSVGTSLFSATIAVGFGALGWTLFAVLGGVDTWASSRVLGAATWQTTVLAIGGMLAAVAAFVSVRDPSFTLLWKRLNRSLGWTLVGLGVIGCLTLGYQFLAGEVGLDDLVWVLAELEEQGLQTSGELSDLPDFLGVLGVSAVIFALGLDRFPKGRLLSSEAQERVRRPLGAIHTFAWLLGLCSLFIMVIWLANPSVVASGVNSLPYSLDEWVVRSATSETLRLALVVMSLSIIASAIAVWGLRRLRARYLLPKIHLGANLTGGIVLGALIVVVAGDQIEAALRNDQSPGRIAEFADIFGGEIVSIVLIGGLFVSLWLGLWALDITRYFYSVPENHTGPTIAASGVTVAAIAAGLLVGPSLWLFVAVGLGIIAWDLFTFGHQLRVELPDDASTRRVEVIHGVAVTAIVGVAILVVTAVFAFTPSRLDTGPAVTFAALAAAIFLLIEFRKMD